MQPVIEIDEGVRRPDLPLKILAGYDLAGVLDQDGKHLQRLASQAQLHTAFSQLSRTSVELVVIETKCAADGRGGHGRLPKTRKTLSQFWAAEYGFGRGPEVRSTARNLGWAGQPRAAVPTFSGPFI